MSKTAPGPVIEQLQCVHLSDWHATNCGDFIYLGLRPNGCEVIMWLCAMCWDNLTGKVLSHVLRDTLSKFVAMNSVDALLRSAREINNQGGAEAHDG